MAKRAAVAALALVATVACAGGNATEESEMAPEGAEEATAMSDNDAGWRPLFDGETLAGWRGYQGKEPSGWTVEDGTIARVGPSVDLVTEEEFGDFELALEWKVEEGGNSGIIYRVTEEGPYPYYSGPEMQVLDDARHRDGQSPLTSAGSNYALHPAPRGVVRPAGEWNEARILVDDGHVEHWLNGQKVVEYELGSEDWKRRVAESKFADWPRYGQASRGRIALQDHGDRVWYRNVRIRELE